MKTSAAKKYNLVVVAHPDDETIFFGGLLQVYRRRPWKVVCVTDGNADAMGEKRRKDFAAATHALRANSSEMWNFPDRFENRLDINALVEKLKTETPSEIFTHGILGEYGHPHHQDVCLAVHRAFEKGPPIWSAAYNCFAEKTFRIPRRAYEKKCEILSKIYFSETHRFARWLPCYNQDGFVRLMLPEIETIYGFFARNEKIDPSVIKNYGWFIPYLEDFRSQVNERPF